MQNSADTRCIRDPWCSKMLLIWAAHWVFRQPISRKREVLSGQEVLLFGRKVAVESSEWERKQVLQAAAAHQCGLREAEGEREPNKKRKFKKIRPATNAHTYGAERLQAARQGVQGWGESFGCGPTGSYIEKACLSRRRGVDEGVFRLESPPYPSALTPYPTRPQTWATTPGQRAPGPSLGPPKRAVLRLHPRDLQRWRGITGSHTHIHKHKDQRKHNSCSVDVYVMLGLIKWGCSDGQEV